MAEGLLEGVLGGEEEKVDSTDSGPEPFAAAVAATLVHQSPAVAAKTAAFFEKQVEVLEIQKKNLQAEYEFFEAEWTPRLLALRLRAAFQVFFALFAGVIGLGLAIVIYEAVESRSVVVAAGLLDVLSKIQVATRSSAAHPSVVSAWYNDVTIEVPEAGISIGQLERVIRTRFGHDQQIEGELVLADKGGYALTVRGNGIPSSTFMDPSGDLASLLKQAGEYVYGQSQPGLWAWYLGDNGRSAEAINFSQNMFQSASLVQRPFILNAWANAIVNQAMDNADERALDLYREAVRLDSSYLIPLNNIMQMLTNLGREEEVIPVGKQLIKAAGGRPGRADENLYQYLDTAERNLQALRAGFVDDMASHGGLGSITSSNGPEGLNVAEIDILLHDLDAAKSLPVFDAAGQDGKVDAVFAAIGSLRFVDCTRFKADILDRHGNWPAAKEWYAKAVELAPSLPAGYYSWGLALARHGDLEAAAAKFKDANQRGPHWADPLKAWADVLLKQGKTKAALEKYDAALAEPGAAQGSTRRRGVSAAAGTPQLPDRRTFRANGAGGSMRDQEIRAALDRHWTASDVDDFETEHDIYREDAVLEYPQSGERIRGRRDIQLSRTNQPNKKRFAVRRIVGSGDLWITEYVLTYDGKPSYTVSIMEFSGDKVARETQYFADPFEAGASRAQWVEPMDAGELPT